jgi:hypothetical protein
MQGFLSALTVSVLCTVTAIQVAEPTGAAAIMESLLFGFEIAPPRRTAGLPIEIDRSLARYRARARMFRPTIQRPADLDGPAGSLYYKRVGVERALFSLFDHANSMQLAEDFATSVALSYEWEGFADVPLGEAASADSFLVLHPNSPIAGYVRLFAGHRKLCAVSGLEGLDPGSDRGQQVAREADRQLAQARDDGQPLIRIVAEYLLTTRKCFER